MGSSIIKEDDRARFQQGLLALFNSTEETVEFINQIKLLKFDLSNDYVLMGFFLAPSLITDLYLMHQAGVLEKINGLRMDIEGEKYKEVSGVESLKFQNEFVSILNGKDKALDFIECMQKLNLDFREDNKLRSLEIYPAEIQSLARYYLLGFIPKLINIQQAIEIQLKSKGII